MLIRALIVLLLVLNAGVAAWWHWSTPAPAADPVALPPNVARLQLVRERDPRQAETPAPAASKATPPAKVTGPVDADAAPADAPGFGEAQCYSLGPFTADEVLLAAQSTLAPRVEALAVRRVPPRPGRGWRVYLPPAPSAEAATAAAERIAAAGFRDYFIVREGTEAHSVALGRFATEAAARRHADALNAAGFAARAEPLGATPTNAWLDVRSAAGFDADTARAQTGAREVRPLDCAALR